MHSLQTIEKCSDCNIDLQRKLIFQIPRPHRKVPPTHRKFTTVLL